MKLAFEQFNAGRCLIFILLTVFVVMVGLFLDGYIRLSIWTVFMPIWIWKFVVLVGAFSGMIVWAVKPSSREEQGGEGFRSTHVQFRAMIISTVLHLLLLLFEMLICIKVENSTLFPWTLVFVPLLVVSLLSMLLCLWAIRNQRSPEMEVICAVNVLQFVLVGIRMDGYILWRWKMTFIPIWIVLTVAIVIMLTMLFIAIYMRYSKRRAERRPDHRIIAGEWHYDIGTPLSHGLVLLPLATFAVFFVGKLDGENNIPFSVINIPLYISLIASTFKSFNTKPGNIWWFGLRRDFCRFMIMDGCPCLQEYANISYKLQHTNPPANSADTNDESPSNIATNDVIILFPSSSKRSSNNTSPSSPSASVAPSVQSIGMPD